MSAEALRQALVALDLHGTIEARGALAVLALDGDAAALSDPGVRARAVSLASEHGFTNLAIELNDPTKDPTSHPTKDPTKDPTNDPTGDRAPLRSD